MKNSEISFEYKCNQKLNALRQNNGRLFCDSCQASIHDLTDKSKREIKEYIIQNGGSICGQFFQDQIEDPPPSKSGMSFKLVAASVAAFFTLSISKGMAQSKDSVKTEQHAISPVADNNSEVVLVNGDSVCTVYTTDDFNLGNSKKEFRKKEYMVIGKQHFFVMNKFPFFVSRKFHRGKMRYRSAF